MKVTLKELCERTGARGDVLMTIAREHARLPYRCGFACLFDPADADFIAERYRALHEPEIVRYSRPRRTRPQVVAG